MSQLTGTQLHIRSKYFPCFCYVFGLMSVCLNLSTIFSLDVLSPCRFGTKGVC
nr:hypothetical protein Iba_chr10bCG9910 [Ipomoea batatas]